MRQNIWKTRTSISHSVRGRRAVHCWSRLLLNHPQILPSRTHVTLGSAKWAKGAGQGLAGAGQRFREVALKEVRPDWASRNAIRMTIKEAQITGQLQHPNIVPVYEVNQ